MPEAISEDRHGLGTTGRPQFEDVDGSVHIDNNIFDSVALPELPVTYHVDAEAVDTTTTAAAATAQHGHGAAAEAADITHQYPTVGDIPTLAHALAAGSGLPAAAAGYNPVQNEVGQPMPMQEAIVPTKWLSQYEDLKQYKEAHGDLNVANYGNKNLYSWIRTQKQQHKLLREGKTNHMSQMRIDLLNEIGFEWAGEGREKFWNLRYQELVDFHTINGTTRVPEKYEAAPQLQTWVSLQRRQMKMRNLGRPTTLTDERVRLLQAVGLECKIRASTTWMDRFMELKRYKDQHGDCDVPQKWKHNVSLGRWVDNQKTQHQKLYDGKPTHLTIERIQLLVSLGFNWRRK